MKALASLGSFLRRHKALMTYYATLVAAYIVLITAMWVWVGHFNGRVSFFVRAVTDGIMIYGIYALLPRRLQWVPVAVTWLIAAVMCCEVWYCRYFADIIPMYVMHLADNVEPLVLSNLKFVTMWSDLLFVAVPAAITALYCACWRRAIKAEVPLSKRQVIIGLVTYLLYLPLVQIYYINGERRYLNSLGFYPTLKENLISMYLEYPTPLEYSQMMGLGFPTYFIDRPLLELLDSDEAIDYTPEQQALIDEALAGRPRYSVPSHPEFALNRGKNVIFIIVESLNAWNVDYHIGDYYPMPHLRSLLAEEGTIVSKNIVTQTSCGVSSDGQFIYNTGLLPLKDMPVVFKYADMGYRTLAEQFPGYYRSEIICERVYLWNHRMTNKAYHYDSLESLKEIFHTEDSVEIAGYDKNLVDYTLRRLPELPEPFFVQMTTLSMHTPFELKGFGIPEAVEKCDTIDADTKHFIAATAFTDKCIGAFIDSLKTSGLYDRTVIFIASDHDLSHTNLAYKPAGNEVVFAALNTGVTREVSTTAGQLDVYPTVLDIMGVTRPSWNGLGSSILSGKVTGAARLDGSIAGTVDETEAARLRNQWETSRLMIKGDWFRKQR